MFKSCVRNMLFSALAFLVVVPNVSAFQCGCGLCYENYTQMCFVMPNVPITCYEFYFSYCTSELSPVSSTQVAAPSLPSTCVEPIDTQLNFLVADGIADPFATKVPAEP